MVNGFKTVAEFIAMLQKLPPNAPMIISTDEEGNNLRRLNGVGKRYVTELAYNYMEEIDEEELDEYDSWVLTAEVW